jgi:SAM-dependent methyltransferase
MTLYDRIASFYDPWSRSVVEDVDFYVEEALSSGGPVVELAVGTGRIAVPIAEAGIAVIGVDASAEMLAVARERASAAGVAELVDLRIGDLRAPPVSERVPLAICPFRSLLHMETEAEKLQALIAVHELLELDGRFVFDVFSPSAEDIAETHDRWLEREPGIFERAVWDESSRTLELSVRSGEVTETFLLHWLSAPEWLRLLEQAGFEVEEVYGWFDRRPYDGDEDMVFVTNSGEVSPPSSREALEGTRTTEGAMSTAVQEILRTHPAAHALSDELVRCIEECFACAQSCTACADACLGEEDVAGLRKCIRLDLDCADLCTATGRILSRQTEPDTALLRTTVEACAQACRACAEECERHAQHHEHCRVCAEACRRCEEACRSLLAAV